MRRLCVLSLFIAAPLHSQGPLQDQVGYSIVQFTTETEVHVSPNDSSKTVLSAAVGQTAYWKDEPFLEFARKPALWDGWVPLVFFTRDTTVLNGFVHVSRSHTPFEIRSSGEIAESEKWPREYREAAVRAQVKLGMTEKMVRFAWGTPTKAEEHESSVGTTVVYLYDNIERQGKVTFKSGKVTDIERRK